MNGTRPSAWPVLATAAAAYAAFTLAALGLHGWTPLWFVWIGERYADLTVNGRTGYDGQFAYYLARDGWAAVPHLDHPAYRMQRIVYPLAARLLAAGSVAALPWAMVAINFVAILVTTLLLTRWLITHRVWRWYGLVYPFFVGNLMSYSRDLTEPLAYALALGGILAWLHGRAAAAVALLAASALTRETTIVAIAALGAAELLRGRWKRAAVLASAAAPILIYQTYLYGVFGASPARPLRLNLLLGTATFSALSIEPGRVSALLFIGLPTLALAPLVVRWLAETPRDAIAWLVFAHWLFAAMLPTHSHLHVLLAGRLSSALLLTLLLAFPRCTPRVRTAIAAFAIVPTVLWLPPVLWWAPWTAKV